MYNTCAFLFCRCYTYGINHNAYIVQDNHVYNLMKQYVQEHKSLWRIKRDYIKDAKGHPDAIAFWKKMQVDKEKHSKELQALIKKYTK